MDGRGPHCVTPATGPDAVLSPRRDCRNRLLFGSALLNALNLPILYLTIFLGCHPCGFIQDRDLGICKPDPVRSLASSTYPILGFDFSRTSTLNRADLTRSLPLKPEYRAYQRVHVHISLETIHFPPHFFSATLHLKQRPPSMRPTLTT